MLDDIDTKPEQPEQPKPVLDLDGPITKDQFEDAVKDAHKYLEEDLKNRHSWCEDRYKYFGATLPGYLYDEYDETGKLDMSVLPEYTDTDRAAMLRDMRGKLLWYASAGAIKLEEANEIFRYAGLPEYPSKYAQGFRLKVHIPFFNINVRADDREHAQAWATEHISEYIARMMDGGPARDDDRYVPGSVVMGKIRDVTAHHDPVRPTIDEADIVRPSVIW